MTDKSLIAERLKIKPDTDADEIEDCGCFGYLRGIRDRCPMIAFIQPSGDSFAFAYTDLTRVFLLRKKQIELYFSSAIVTLHGSHFDLKTGLSLHSGLKLHRVPWVKAVDELKIKQPSLDSAIVTKIEIDDALLRVKS